MVGVQRAPVTQLGAGSFLRQYQGATAILTHLFSGAMWQPNFGSHMLNMEASLKSSLKP